MDHEDGDGDGAGLDGGVDGDSGGGMEPIQTGTNAWHWSRFELPGARGVLVPVGFGTLVPVHGTNRD